MNSRGKWRVELCPIEMCTVLMMWRGVVGS